MIRRGPSFDPTLAIVIGLVLLLTAVAFVLAHFVYGDATCAIARCVKVVQ